MIEGEPKNTARKYKSLMGINPSYAIDEPHPVPLNISSTNFSPDTMPAHTSPNAQPTEKTVTTNGLPTRMDVWFNSKARAHEAQMHIDDGSIQAYVTKKNGQITGTIMNMDQVFVERVDAMADRIYREEIQVDPNAKILADQLTEIMEEERNAASQVFDKDAAIFVQGLEHLNW